MIVKPPGRLPAEARARLASLVALAAGLAWSGSAVAAGYNPGHLAPSDQAQVAGLCTGVLGISHGNRQFDACMEALSASVREQAGAQDLSGARGDCEREGAVAGAALARCELSVAEDARAAGAVAVLPVQPPLATRPARSYWMVSNAEVRQREETACADLGLEPAGRLFGRCVSGLDTRLFNANNPSQ